MKALQIFAGPAALRRIGQHGLNPRDIGVVVAAAGGPKGLILGPLDRFVFGEWLPRSQQPVDLVGASIGSWRMATACLRNPAEALERFERLYVAQQYELAPGRKTPTPAHVSETFDQFIRTSFRGHAEEVLRHPRYRLHVVTSRGRHLLSREHPLGTPLGYLGAFLANALQRKALGAWLERVVFSSAGADALPFCTTDFNTRRVTLTERNLHAALLASSSVPLVVNAVHDIPGAPRGAYWDGGITDYHLHLDYRASSQAGLVLYPHFQNTVIPGWLDKGFKWRHRATAFLDNVLLVCPKPEWVKLLPNGKLPDRSDFYRYRTDSETRMRLWSAAIAAASQLADEFAQWLERPDFRRVESL